MFPLKKNQDRQCKYEHNTAMHSRNHCCHGKSASVTYSECASVALVIQHAMSKRHYSHSLTYVRVASHGTFHKSYFMQVGISLN